MMGVQLVVVTLLVVGRTVAEEEDQHRRRWAVLGTGLGARIVAEAVGRSKRGALVMVGSRDPVEAASKWGLPDSAVGTYDETLRRGADVVYVGLPTALKKEWAIRACESAASVVIVDKPFGTSFIDAADMFRRCEALNTTLADAAAFAYSDAWTFVERMLPTRDAQYVFHVPVLAGRETTNSPRKRGAVKKTSGAGIRVDPDLEPQAVVGDLGYYALRALLPLARDPAAAAESTSCSAHAADAESGALVDVSGRLELGSFRASFSISWIQPLRDEISLYAADGSLSAHGVVAGDGAKRLRLLRHAFADNTTSDAVFSHETLPHDAAVSMVDALSGGPTLPSSDMPLAVMRGLDACMKSIEAELEDDDTKDTRTEASLEGSYAADGVAVLPPDTRLPADVLDKLRLGFAAAVIDRPESLVYDDRQAPRLKTSLCSAWEGLRRPCNTLMGTGGALSTIALNALSEHMIPRAVAVLGAETVELISVSCDLNGPRSVPQHPHFDPIPRQWNPADVHYLFVPLVDVDATNGPLEVWPGTHVPEAHGWLADYLTLTKANPDVRRVWTKGGGPLQSASITQQHASLFDALPSTIVAPVPAGAGVLVQPAAWHRGTANSKFVDRPVLTVILLAHMPAPSSQKKPPPENNKRRECRFGVAVDGAEYSVDLEAFWRSVRWDLLAARALVRAVPRSPDALQGGGCTTEGCVLQRVSEAVRERRAECDAEHAKIPRILHLLSDTRQLSPAFSKSRDRCVALNPGWEHWIWTKNQTQALDDTTANEALAVARRYGGVVAPAGTECLRPLDDVFASEGRVFVGDRLESLAAAPPGVLDVGIKPEPFPADVLRSSAAAAEVLLPDDEGTTAAEDTGPLTWIRELTRRANASLCADLVVIPGAESDEPEHFPPDADIRVCVDEIAPPCVVYSFGIAGNWLFDDTFARRGCDVRSYDPSMPDDRHWRSPTHLFEPVGIGNFSGTYVGKSTLFSGETGYEVRTLEDLMRANGHDHVDVVRMDVESAEWPVLEQWTRDGTWSNIGQLLVEIHLFDDILDDGFDSGKHAADFARILQNIPMDLFSAERNVYDETPLLPDLTRIHELGFVRPNRARVSFPGGHTLILPQDPSLIDARVDAFFLDYFRGKTLAEEDPDRRFDDEPPRDLVEAVVEPARWPPFKPLKELPFFTTHQNTSRMLLVSASDRRSVAEATWPSWRAYADARGYGFLPIDTSDEAVPFGEKLQIDPHRKTTLFFQKRSAHHLKLWLLHELAEVTSFSYEAVVWIDDDILCTAPEVDLFERCCRDREDVVLVDEIPAAIFDAEPFNTGVLAVAHPGPRAMAALRAAWLAPFFAPNQCLLKECWFWDNTALAVAFEQHHHTAGLVILPYGTMQRFWGEITCATELFACAWFHPFLAWRPGDLAAHAGGGSSASRVSRLALIQERSQQDEVSMERVVFGHFTKASYAQYREGLYLALLASRICAHPPNQAPDLCRSFHFEDQASNKLAMSFDPPASIPALEAAVLAAYGDSTQNAFEAIHARIPLVEPAACDYDFVLDGIQFNGTVQGTTTEAIVAEMRAVLSPILGARRALGSGCDTPACVADALLLDARVNRRCRAGRIHHYISDVDMKQAHAQVLGDARARALRVSENAAVTRVQRIRRLAYQLHRHPSR